MVAKTVQITKEQQNFLKDNSINFSSFVRKKLDELIKGEIYGPTNIR